MDLPTQKQLLAQFRCDEIAAVAFGKVAKATKKSVAEVEGGAVIADLGQTLNTLRSGALDEYHTLAHRYDQAVYEKVKESLRDKIHANFYPLFTGSVRNLLRRIQKQFYDDLTVPSSSFVIFHPSCIIHSHPLSLFYSPQHETSKDNGSSFIEVANSLKTTAIDGFSKPAQELVLSETDWSFAPALDELREVLDSEIKKKKEEHQKKSLEAFKKSLQISLIEPLSAALGKADDNMWAKIQGTVVLAESHADAYAEKCRKSKSWFWPPMFPFDRLIPCSR